MHALATVPDFYGVLTELNTVQSLLQLLSHDNTDISTAVVDLLQVGLVEACRIINPYIIPHTGHVKTLVSCLLLSNRS